MDYPAVLLVSVVLGIDAFSVAVCIGLSGAAGRREMLLVPATVAAFHVFMPLVGLSMGAYLGKIAGPVAGTIGALVLIGIGLSMTWDHLKKAKGECGVNINTSSLLALLAMAVSVSLDALTVGIGLGTLKVDLVLTVLSMGVIAGLMTVTGLLFGGRLGHAFGEKAGLAGGIILAAIGIKLLL